MTSTSWIAVTAGVTYLASVWAEVTQWTTDTIFGCYVDWYTAGNAYISSSTIVSLTAEVTDTQYVVEVAAPPTAAQVKLRGAWDCTAGAATESAFVHHWSFSRSDCWAAEDASYTLIDVTDFEPGEYMVLTKCKTEDNTDPGTIQQQFGVAVTLTNEDLDWIPLGIVTLPASAVRSTAVSTLTLTITGTGADKKVFANAIAFIPCSFGGMIGWRKANSTTHNLRWENSLVYADDIGAVGNSFCGRILRTRGGILVIVAEQPVAQPTTHVHLTVSAAPRWEQFPDAGSFGIGPGI
jgi:hypothetical protein